MPQSQGYCVRRVATTAEQGRAHGGFDYADSFAVDLESPDAHSPEQWARAALEQAAPAVRWIIGLAQVRLLRLRLRPRTDGEAVLGWQVLSSTSDALLLRAAGPLLSGDIAAWRASPRRLVVTTSLDFERRLGRLMWLLVGPLHRRIAGYLLRRAAEILTAGARGGRAA